MTFDLLKIPFYKALYLFETGEPSNLKEAFELFLKCAMKGNVYAPYYVDYFLKSPEIDKHIRQIVGEQKCEGFIKELSEHLQRIPTQKRPQDYLSSSILIRDYQTLNIEFNKNKDDNSLKKIKKYLSHYYKILKTGQQMLQCFLSSIINK